MAFSDDITLRDNAAADKTFSRQIQEPQRCTWIDTSTTPQEPRLLRISHRKESMKGLAGEFQDRHTIELMTTKKDTVTGKPYTQVVTLSVQYPLTGPLVRADLDHLISFLKVATNGILTNSTLIDRLLRSEL